MGTHDGRGDGQSDSCAAHQRRKRSNGQAGDAPLRQPFCALRIALSSPQRCMRTVRPISHPVLRRLYPLLDIVATTVVDGPPITDPLNEPDPRRSGSIARRYTGALHTNWIPRVLATKECFNGGVLHCWSGSAQGAGVAAARESSWNCLMTPTIILTVAGHNELSLYTHKPCV